MLREPRPRTVGMALRYWTAEFLRILLRVFLQPKVKPLDPGQAALAIGGQLGAAGQGRLGLGIELPNPDRHRFLSIRLDLSHGEWKTAA